MSSHNPQLTTPQPLHEAGSAHTTAHTPDRRARIYCILLPHKLNTQHHDKAWAVAHATPQRPKRRWLHARPLPLNNTGPQLYSPARGTAQHAGKEAVRGEGGAQQHTQHWRQKHSPRHNWHEKGGPPPLRYTSSSRSMSCTLGVGSAARLAPPRGDAAAPRPPRPPRCPPLPPRPPVLAASFPVMRTLAPPRAAPRPPLPPRAPRGEVTTTAGPPRPRRFAAKPALLLAETR